MATANDFYVAPLGGYNLAEGIGDAVEGGEKRYRSQQIKEKMPEVLKSGDPQQIFDFVSEYPEAVDLIKGATGYADEARLKAKVEPAKQILIDGVDPVQVYEELAKTHPEDPMNLHRLGEAIQDKEAAKKRAERTLALYDTDAYKSYLTMFPDAVGQKEGPTTTEDRYVKDRMPKWEAEHPEATKADKANQRAEYRLEHKRAQAAEVRGTEMAKQSVQTQFAKEKAYQTQLGKAMAEIETATKVTHAQGKLTPQEKKAQAKQGVTNKVATLAGYYAELDRLGAIVNVENNTMDNIWAKIQSTGLGQYAGTVLGTKPQSIRNAIRSMKPQLINDIRQATEMGSRGLDSEKELEFYLQAVSDESRDVQANMAALVVLDEAYGDGQIAEQLREFNMSPEYIQEIKQQGELIVNGALLSDVEKAARIKAGRKPLTPSTAKPSKPGSLSQPAQPAQPAQQQTQPQQYPNGTIIKNDASGERMIMQGGKWSPYNG